MLRAWRGGQPSPGLPLAVAAQGLAGAAQMPSPALPQMSGSRGRLAADRLRLAVPWAAAAGVGGTPDAAPAGPATTPP